MGTLTETDLHLLRSNQSRIRLYAAPFGTYKLLISTVLKDARTERDVQRTKWKDILNIGPHRLAFVGETITFDALDSYKMNFDAGNKKRQGRKVSQGYGAGKQLPNLDWRIYQLDESKGDHQVANKKGQQDRATVWRQYTQPWQETQSWTPDTPGLYQLTCSASTDKQQTAAAIRWIRVYASREETDWNITAISSCSGSWGQGWTMDVELKTTDITLQATGVRDYQCLGIFAEEEWWDGDRWVVHPIGADRQDPRVVMIGYVREGTIATDWESRTVTLSVESITGQMSTGMMHKIAIWDEKGPDTSIDRDAIPSVEEATPAERRRARRKARREANNGVDVWGASLQGFGHVSIPDFALYLLQFKTNIMEWHDVWTVWDDQLANLESIAGEEGDPLSVLTTVAGNDWYVVGADHANHLYFAPDRLVTIDNDWERRWPQRMTVTNADCLNFTTRQMHQKEVKYVKLIATKTADFQPKSDDRKKAKRQTDRNQIEESYPKGKNPPVNQAGTWFSRTDLLHDNKMVIRQRARRVYEMMNNKWETTLILGMNRALRPGDYVRVNLETDRTLWDGKPKKFLVDSVSYEFDPGAGTCTCSLSLQETVEVERE